MERVRGPGSDIMYINFMCVNFYFMSLYYYEIAILVTIQHLSHSTPFTTAVVKQLQFAVPRLYPLLRHSNNVDTTTDLSRETTHETTCETTHDTSDNT